MNRVLSPQVAAGFCEPSWSPCGVAPSVARHRLTAARTRVVFATDTAELMAGAGVRVVLLPRLLPTPYWPSPFATWR
jgi:phosphomannomutase